MVSPIRAYLSPTPRQLRILLHIPLLCIEFVEMGGGAAQRRRIKNFEKANVSLHKAAQGKGKTSMPLPAAPTKDDYRDKMPASLRKMLALKEVTEQPAKRRKLDPAGGLQQQQQQSLRGQPGAGASSTQADAPQQQPQRHNKQQQQEGAQQQQQQQQHAAQNASAAWQQPKKLKQKKKEYLNAKKLKKKGKKGRATNGAAAAAEDDDVELPSDRVAFGEVVHAPPHVALKSKHWAANTQQQQHSSGKKQKQQHPPKQQDEELEQMREQLIETYRSGRPAPQEGQATLKTLKALVKKQQGGG